MTVICGGGTSSVKPTATASIAYTSGLIAELLQAVESPWLIPVIPLLTLPTIGAAALCASDPPAQPTFTLAEAEALLAQDIGTSDWISGVTKVEALLANAIWYQICQCDSVTTPKVPIAPSPPVGVAVPTFSNTPGIQPCNTFIYTSVSHAGGSQNQGGPVLGGLVPSSFTFTAKNTIADGTGSVMDYAWVQYKTGNPNLRTDTVRLNQGDTKVITVPAAAGVAGIFLETNAVSGTGGTFITNSQVDTYCGGAGLPSATSTCPPDPTVLALLEQILGLLTIVQRQSVPFAYIPGTAHGPLGLTGEFDLASIVLGLKIEVTGIDGTVGEQILDPLRLFDVGWVSIGDADGFWCQTRVTNPSMLYFPKFAGSATKVGWTSTSNARLTITELLRER